MTRHFRVPGFKNSTMKNEKTEEVWIDKQEIMMRMHISDRTLQTWRSKGLLPYTCIGRKIFYKESDLKNLLNSHIKRKSSSVLSRAQYGNTS